MKKALILCYDFPPLISAGSLRPYSWFKYMNEFGVYPVIVTRQWDNKYGNHLDYVTPGYSSRVIVEASEYGTIIKTPGKSTVSNRLLLKYGDSKFRYLRKWITAYYEFGQFLFFCGPKSPLYFAARDYLKSNTVNAVIATGDPFILFKYASKLSKKYKIPWIADYRDPWTNDPETGRYRVIRKWNSFFEKKYLQSAIAITTVTRFYASSVNIQKSKERVHIIPNGYDLETVDKVKGIAQNDKKLNIAYTGTIYNWHPIESFFNACRKFVQNNKDVEFRINFYGINSKNEIQHLLQTKYAELIPFVEIHPKVPYEKLLKALAANHLFLLFDHYHFISAKIYDYIALKRTILLCFTDDPEANELRKKFYRVIEIDSESDHLHTDLINATHSGIIVKDTQHLSTLLEKLYLEFQANGYIDCHSVGIEKYSRKYQTQKLAEIINKL